jgi:hypothetical protein
MLSTVISECQAGCTASPSMKFNIYGRFQVEVNQENGTWVAYHVELGKRRKLEELVIPADIKAEEIASYLDDIYHEYAEPGRRVEPLP